MSDNLEEVKQLTSDNLQMLIHLAPYLHQILGEESVLTITDRERYLYMAQGTKLTLPVQSGDPFTEGSMADTTMKAGQKVVKRVPKEVLGTPYIGLGIPVRDEDGRFIGAIAIGKPIETQEKVSNMAEELSSSMENIATVSSGLMSASEQLAATAQELAENTSGIEKDIKEMDNVIALIKEVSDQTHLLGLNAAIEAARAGDQGKGFAVVAEEVRKLAEKSSGAAKQIYQLINDVQSETNRAVSTMTEGEKQVNAGTKVIEEVGKSFEGIIGAVQGLTEQIQDVAAAAQEMSAAIQNVSASTQEQTAAMEEISASAESLDNLGDDLIKMANRFRVQ